jgi:hypothetical protein
MAIQRLPGKPKENLLRLARGQTMRGILGAMVKPDDPVPLDALQDILRVSRVGVLQQPR